MPSDVQATSEAAIEVGGEVEDSGQADIMEGEWKSIEWRGNPVLEGDELVEGISSPDRDSERGHGTPGIDDQDLDIRLVGSGSRPQTGQSRSHSRPQTRGSSGSGYSPFLCSWPWLFFETSDSEMKYVGNRLFVERQASERFSRRSSSRGTLS
eukprot:100421-Rhodomonas_salina.1